MSVPDVPAPAGTSFPAVSPPPTAASTATAASVPRWPVVVLVVAGAVCLIAMVPLFRHGVVAHAFPSYVENDPSYAVQRWSAPWVGGALAVGGSGLVCWAIAGGLLSRGRRHRVATRSAAVNALSATPPAVSTVPAVSTLPAVGEMPGLAPRPTEAAREY